MEKEIAIVYMVAGMSSRFQGKIKQFAQVGPNNEILTEYSLNQALKAGFSKIVFIVGNKTEQPFKEKFKDNFQGIPIQYTLQTFDESERDKPWGTADALCTLKNTIDCPFVICNGDDIYGEEAFKILYNHLQNFNESAVIGYKLINVIPEQGKTNRAIFQVNENNYVQNLEEIFDIEKSNLELTNTKPDNLCSMNIYGFHPEIINHLEQERELFKQQNKGDRKIEFLLPNEVNKLIKNNKIKIKLYSTSEKTIGITNPEDEEVVRSLLAEQEQQSHQQ